MGSPWFQTHQYIWSEQLNIKCYYIKITQFTFTYFATLLLLQYMQKQNTAPFINMLAESEAQKNVENNHRRD